MRDDDRIREFWSRYLSRENVTEEEEHALSEALEANEALRDELLREAEMDGLLRGWAEGVQDSETAVRSFLEYLAAERDAGRFIQEVQSLRKGGEKPRPRPSSRRWARKAGSDAAGLPWRLGLAAAGALVVVILALTGSSSGPTPPREARTAGGRAQREDERRKASSARQELASQARGERERLEKELAAQEDEKRRLAEAQMAAKDERERQELKAREAELAKAAEAFKEKVRIAREKEREAAAAAQVDAPLPAPEPSPAKLGTRAAVAKVDRVEGEAYRVTPAGKAALQGGEDILLDQGIETVGAGSRAILVFGDKTRLVMEAETALGGLRVEQGKRVFLEKGAVRAEVAKQPPGRPMVFATRDGEATVLGTTLRLVMDPDPKRGTRLEVEEGKVRLKNLAGKTVLVESGHYAVAAAGATLAATLLPIDQVLLLPRDARIIGGAWRPVGDDKASSGQAIETLRPGGSDAQLVRQIKARSPCLEYVFQAEGDKDYFLWVRGACMAPGGRKQDSVAVEVVEGRFDRTCLFLGPFGVNAILYDGWGRNEGYWWIGGNGSEGQDTVAAAVRFNRPGRQAIRVYVSESPLRLDSLWLSTSQKTRPEASSAGPAK